MTSWEQLSAHFGFCSISRHGEDIGKLYFRLAAECFDGDAAEQHDGGEQADDLECEHGAVPHHLAAGQSIGDVANQAAGDVTHRLAGKVRHAPGADVEPGGLGDCHVQHKAEVGYGHQPTAEPKHEDGTP